MKELHKHLTLKLLTLNKLFLSVFENKITAATLFKVEL